MTKNDIVLSIAETSGISQTEVKKIVQNTLDAIIDALKREGRLELRNFGVFEVRNRKARKARNPRTGEEVMVPPCRVVSFKAGKRMEKVISDGHGEAKATPESGLPEAPAESAAE